MKKSIQNRIRKGLFPEMPQSFADRLTGALKIGGALNADQRSAEEAPTAPVLPERSKRRFPFGKIFNGVAAAVLAALCIVIAVFGIILPNVQKTHGATHPDGYRADFPVGKWTLTEVENNGWKQSPAEMGVIFMVYLEFTEDGRAIETTRFNDEVDREVFRYSVNGASIDITASDGTILQDAIVYDAATDTLRMDVTSFMHHYGFKATLTFSYTPDAVIPAYSVDMASGLAGKWTRTRSKYASQGTDYSWIDVDMESWQSWLEITADGHTHLTEYDSKSGEALHADFSVAIGSDGIQTDWESCTGMWYDTAADTICMEIVGRRRDYYSRTPDAEIPEGERREITALRSQYPEYFGLDMSKGLKVYVWQMAESSYSCALISGTDERSEIEIGMMKGVTIEQMRLILSTYGLEEKEIEVVPFHNSISSYWYEIDNDYKVWIRRLVKENMPFTNEELEGLKSPPFSIADVVYDVDGDGQLETCSLNRGPTSSDITVVFTVYRNGTLAYRNTFDMNEGEMTFSRSDSGLRIAHTIPWNDGIQLFTEYTITIEDGVLVLTDELRGKTVEYWGELDPQWNMAVVKTPEERLEGLWCAMNLEKGWDGLKEIRFYQDEKRGVRCASFYESGILYDGYTYTREEQESDRQDCSKSYLFTFANENGHERKLILYIRDHNEDEIDEDRTPWKDDSEQHTFDTFLKLTPITAEELPMKQDKYIGAGEGKVYYLDLVDLNGDGKPVRVSVYGYTPVSVVTGEEGESELTVQIGACEWKINEKLVMDSGIYIDLDPNDGHGNLLLSTTRADGTERTYELHLEKNAEAFGDRRDSFTLVCGHTVEGYCFLNDSEQQELMLGTPTDLLGAKYGYREVKGEALEPADEWLQASALIERVMFGKREDNIKDGTLLHLVRALPCEIDGKPATLEPGVYLHLREWHESMDRIVFLTEDDRWITVYLDGTAPYTVGGVPLADYFDNAPKG